MKKESTNFNEIPESLLPLLESSEPNNEIILDKGEFFIKWKDKEYSLLGEIKFFWHPRLTVKFSGVFPSYDSAIHYKGFLIDIGIEIRSDKLRLQSRGIIQNIHISSNEDSTLAGILANPVILGKPKIDVNFIRFEVPNLRSFNGSIIRKDDTAQKSRLEFEDDDYRIILDKSSWDLKKTSALKYQGGYMLLYTGSIERIDRAKIDYNIGNQVLESFTYFLHFLNGRRTAPLFRQGFNGEESVWKDYTPYSIDSYKYVISWPAKNTIAGLSQLWKNFRTVWGIEGNADCIKSILHWYIEANSNAAYVEGSIVLIQTALELLFHWIISETKGYVAPYDAENLSAAAKTGFLLAHFNISPEIPTEFKELNKYSKSFSITNGPEAFIRIRNCIVHPSKKKRQTLKDVDSRARFEALQLGLWYVETILLKQLGFKGDYNNRCKELENRFGTDDIFN